MITILKRYGTHQKPKISGRLSGKANVFAPKSATST
jgi:hypothetical protein